MCERSPLSAGVEFFIDCFNSKIPIKITRQIGRGGTCIVYEGKKTTFMNEDGPETSIIIKEFYPVGMDISRQEDLSLQIPDRDQFEQKKAHFREGQVKHRRFYDYYLDQTLPSVFLYGKANNTEYAISDPSKGKALSKINPSWLSLNRVASIMESICTAIEKIHAKEMLYLDCKPDNFFYYGTKEDLQSKVYLFDFDTIISTRELQSGNYQFCSASLGWTPPEQELLGSERKGYKNPQLIGYHSDIYSIGAIFFWLLTGRKPDKADLAAIQNSSFQWEAESRVCNDEGAIVLNAIQEITKATLQPDVEKRKKTFSNYSSIRIIKEKFQRIFGLTVGNSSHFEPLYDEIKSLKQLLTKEVSKKTSLPTSRNRFKYNSNSTSFKGRSDEMEVLLEMCEDEASFLWLGICGQGGTGKSRLAYELCSRMINNEWTVFSPLHFSSHKETLYEAVKNIRNHILICLDYVKQNFNAILHFIRYFIENPYSSDYKVRILLIERDKKEVLIDEQTIEEYNYRPTNRAIPCDGFLELQQMEEETIRSIIEDYIINQDASAQLSSESLDLMMNTLKEVDSELERPLYALFIADAWLNHEDLLKWNRKDALDYLLRRERERLASIISDSNYHLNKVEQDKYRAATDFLYVIATYSGSICLEDYADILSLKYGLSDRDELLLAILSEYGILSAEKEVYGWTPDLIGEYFCVNYFNNASTEEVDYLINLVLNKNFSSFLHFSEMMYRDYQDVISEKWLSLLRNIKFPTAYQTTRKNQFSGASFLQNIQFCGRIITIQAGSFRNCVNLERMVFPSSLEIIEANAFGGCTSLKEVTMDDGKGKDPSIILIEHYAFKDCTALESVILPESLQSLGKYAFENCSSLKIIAIPRKITEIESSTFKNCTSLERVTLIKPIQLGDSCFSGCTSLKTIESSQKISSIKPGAFRDCVSLEEILLSSKLIELGDNVFSGCHSLKSMDLSHCAIKSLPVRTFFDCTSLKRVILPERMTKIEDKAFGGCKELDGLIIPEALTEIGPRAFSDCEKIESLVFPASLQKIGSSAFENCKELKELRFLAPVHRIGPFAFRGCLNLSFSNIIGMLKPEAKELCGFEFSSISEREFNFLKTYADLNDLILPDTVVRVGNSAFGSLTTLVNISLPPSVQEIGEKAFWACKNLETVHCEDDKIISLGASAFYHCQSLKRINGRLNLTEINDYTFYHCSSLERLSISNRVSSIGIKAFSGCSNLRKIHSGRRNIPNYIGTGAFEDCPYLRYPIDLNFMQKYLLNPENFCLDGFVFQEIGEKELSFLKYYRSYEEVFIPRTCIDISRVHFSLLTKMKKLVIPESIKTLSPRLFQGCRSLEEIVLPKTIREIPYYAFQDCVALKTLRFGWFKDNLFPGGVKIGEGAFCNCSSLKDIELPKGMNSIQRYSFQGCRSLTEVVIPDTVRGIGKFAFTGCDNLTRVHLPKNLKFMGRDVFMGCVSLLEVSNLENTSLKELRNNMFDGCISLERIALPAELQLIKGHAFNDCRRLNIPRDFLPRTLIKLEIAAFQGCSSIEAIKIPRKITAIEDYTFKGCRFLREVVFSDNITYIGQGAFYHCQSLASEGFRLPEKLKTIQASALCLCHSLTEITIPETISELPPDLFKGCSSLKKVSLPPHIESIPSNCFKDCISLETMELPESLKIINVGAFRNCVSLKVDKDFLPKDLKEIREAAFRYCDSLTEFSIPPNIKRLPSAVFEGCRNLKRLLFEHPISEVGHYAFAGCLSLEEFPFSLIEETIKDAAFRDCKSLRDPEFSDTIKSICPAAFRGCSQIKTFVFPPSLKRISGATLREATRLEKVVIPEEITKIKKSAFRDCINLSKVEIKSPQIALDPRVFKGCLKLDYLDLPEDSTFQEDSFENCPVEIEWIKKD